ncbi:MAG: hypothetical protein HN509_01040 [Halobacteriovoraceae bacterium]|jgi:hypothetical protein|nr:hypothetical protein [Halobacteriovoraceae bacterium]MBT5092685.1 hypothetical protein [Halobacteriovoraceae bacterium]
MHRLIALFICFFLLASCWREETFIVRQPLAKEEERTPSSSARNRYVTCMHEFNKMMDKVEALAEKQASDSRGDWMGPKAGPYWKKAQTKLSLCRDK